LLFNKFFFPIVDTCVSCIFSEPRAAHFRHAFLIYTKATPCVEAW